MTRQYHNWTIEEDALLLELKRQKIPLIEIAQKVNKTLDSTRCRLFQLRKASDLAKYESKKDDFLSGARLGFIDIETSSLEADTGYLLTYVLKVGDEIYKGEIKKSEIFSGKNDQRLLKELLCLIKEKVDILIGYYSSRFDINFLRSRAIYHGLEFFRYGEKYSIDLYYIVKYKLQLHRNSLDAATSFLGIDGKSHVDLEIWNRGKLGDREALSYIMDHNYQDVLITEQLYQQIKDFVKFSKKSI